jgi:hypothetical protein
MTDGNSKKKIMKMTESEVPEERHEIQGSTFRFYPPEI